MAARAGIAAIVIGAATLLLTACAAAPAAPTPSSTPTASPTPTLAASACTWNAVRQPIDGGTLGQFAVALTNTSTGNCLLNGYATALLTGGPNGYGAVGHATSAKLPAGPVLVPAGATAYVPVVLSTTTDGGITGHCSDSRHTVLRVTPPGATKYLAVDVSLLHPCGPQPGFGMSTYPIQANMPTIDDFSR